MTTVGSSPGGAADAPTTPNAASRAAAPASQMDRLRAMLPPSPAALTGLAFSKSRLERHGKATRRGSDQVSRRATVELELDDLLAHRPQRARRRVDRASARWTISRLACRDRRRAPPAGRGGSLPAPGDGTQRGQRHASPDSLSPDEHRAAVDGA